MCLKGRYQESEKKKKHKKTTIPEWKKTFANHIFDKSLASRIHKILLQVYNKNTNIPNTNFSKTQISPEKIYKWPKST